MYTCTQFASKILSKSLKMLSLWTLMHHCCCLGFLSDLRKQPCEKCVQCVWLRIIVATCLNKSFLTSFILLWFASNVLVKTNTCVFHTNAENALFSSVPEHTQKCACTKIQRLRNRIPFGNFKRTAHFTGFVLCVTRIFLEHQFHSHFVLSTNIKNMFSCP